MSEPSLDWGTAEVHDGELSVKLLGDAPRPWRESFQSTVTLLDNSGWGKIIVKKHSVRVADVQPGSEEKLRHHLEAVVQQANADHPPADDAQGERGEDGRSDEGPDEKSPDSEMTERFRAFDDGR
jgi:hypothetical protein